MPDLNSLIAQGITAPVESPIETFSKGLQLKNLMSGELLRQQQIKEGEARTTQINALAQQEQATADQKNRDLKSEDVFGKAFLAEKDPYKALDAAAAAGASPSFVIAKRQALDQAEKAHLEKTDSQRKEELSRLDLYDNALQGINSIPEDQRPVEWKNVIQRSMSNPLIADFVKKGLADGSLPSEYDASKLDQIHAVVLGSKRLNDEAEKKAQIRSQTATAAKNEAELSGIQADSEVKQRKLAAWQNMSTADWAAQVDAVAPPTGDSSKLNTRTKQLVNNYISRGDFDKAEAAIKDASDQLGRTETAVRTAEGKQPIVINTAAATTAARAKAEDTSSPLTEDDYKRAGAKYAITGQLPNLGMGSKNMRARIMHEGEEWARSNHLSPKDVVTAQAAFKGDVQALTTLKKMQASVEQAESAASTNLGNFIKQAGKVVDTGSPWINEPLRKINKGLLGKDDQAAFDTARLVAVNEIAKVLNQTGAGGSGVLSDSARKEVGELIGEGATLKQIYKAANIIKTDLAGRMSGFSTTIDHIESNMGGTHKMMRARDPKGKLHEAPEGTALPDGWTVEH